MDNGSEAQIRNMIRMFVLRVRVRRYRSNGRIQVASRHVIVLSSLWRAMSEGAGKQGGNSSLEIR